MGASALPSLRRLRLEIHGAVQGVGFRPFVYRLATELTLTGWVINDTRGVFIEVEGPQPALAHFLQRLPVEAPPRAIIHSLDSTWLDVVGYPNFEIRRSDHQGSKTVLVLPDIATCVDCLAEVLDPADRRHGYPFTNCTNCGPRFTIIRDLPYDRSHTSMCRFTMCPNCRAEYKYPLDRRFHAQPNACPVCGPGLAFYAPVRDDGRQTMNDERRAIGQGRWTAVVGRWSLVTEGEGALRGTASALDAGRIVAVKGLGGFHLMVDARDGAAISRLRERKPRRDKPFALMVRNLDQARSLCQVSPQAETLLTSPEAPIVLLPRRTAAGIADEVAPGNPCLGIMLPYTPLHHLLLRETGFPVVATSGNLSDEPICTDEWEAMERLGHIADGFLVHDRPIVRHVDDSVVWLLEDAPQILRRARGYAPLPVRMPPPGRQDTGHHDASSTGRAVDHDRQSSVDRGASILAVGAHLKNTVALSVGRQVFISQHIGDLETAQSLAAFERVIADFLRLYEATPVAIAHDLHPDYLSTRWAHNAQLTTHDSPLVPVQHHHAHLAACLADNGVRGPALGVTWDGTGYGTDGTVWGGEFLLGDAAGFSRAAYLRPFRLPGGDAAVKEPRRVALALLWELYGEAALEREDLAPVRAFRPDERRLLVQMLERGLNSPVTTSAGRLFDGVAALLGLQQRVTFEGQAAMALEFAADVTVSDAYPLPARRGDGRSEAGGQAQTHNTLLATRHPPPATRYSPLATRHPPPTTRIDPFPTPLVLDWQPLLEAILADLRHGVDAGIMAARFHNALAEAIVSVAAEVGEPRVALTGGCFQNRRLTERTAQRLRAAGFEVLLHRQVPPNDGGISLGQIAVAAAQLTTMNIQEAYGCQ